MYWQDIQRTTRKILVDNQKVLEKVFLIYFGINYLISQSCSNFQAWAIGNGYWSWFWVISLLMGLVKSCLWMGLVRQICLIYQKEPIRKRDLFLYWRPSNIHKMVLLIGSITAVSDTFFSILSLYIKPLQQNQMVWNTTGMELGEMILQFLVIGLQVSGMVVLIQNPYEEGKKVLTKTWKVFFQSVGHYITIQFIYYCIFVIVIKVGIWIANRFKEQLSGAIAIVVVVSMLVISLVIFAYIYTSLVVLTLEQIENYNNREKKQEGLQ